MALPVPNLDDRRFQDLVDDAKRMLQQRCPELRWTDHNVHDPGVTLIELFAWMTELLLYRLNRVPDRQYVKFLELIGLNLFPPTAARVPVTFWLAAPQPEVVRIPPGTGVATRRTPTDDAIPFATLRPLDIIPSSLAHACSSITEGEIRNHHDDLERDGFACFDRVPKTGDSLLLGLSEAVPSCAVTLRFRCTVEGVGVDPENPPLRWEAWTDEGWVACELESDTTGGLNRDGDVIVHVPPEHLVSVIGERRGGWLRGIVTEVREDQPRYSASPTIHAASAFTCGGTAEAMNGETVQNEMIGTSEGVPGQRFAVRRGPVLIGDPPPVLTVSEGDGWTVWTRVGDFSESREDSDVFVLDAAAGEVVFGPGVRQPDGSLKQYGAVPRKDARLRLTYQVGGGGGGNVAGGSIRELKSSIPYVARVQNRRPAQGGVDAESIDNAKVRGPILLRTRDRAVTTEDYAYLAQEAAPEVARVRCVAAGNGAGAGGVRVLVVPSVGRRGGRLALSELLPPADVMERITARLDECRVVGSRVLVETPLYRGITVVARIRARRRFNAARLQEEALQALYDYFHPVSGGPENEGWPFGRAVHIGEVYSVLQRLRATEFVEDVRLFGADPRTGERGPAEQRLELEAHELVFSYEHQVLVEGAS